MPGPSEYFRSVEWVWAIWFVSCAALGWSTCRVVRRFDRKAIARLLRDEEGAAYSLAYVLTVPLVVMFTSLVIETTMILIVKIGTVYSAYAAARSNIVFRSLDPAGADERARRVAVRGMAPFASSSPVHADGQPRSAAVLDAADYVTAFRRYAPGNYVEAGSLQKRYYYADKATTVRIVKKSSNANAPVEATIKYQVPMHVGGVGRLFGGRRSDYGGNYLVVEISTSVSLPDETPQSANGTLGINYAVPD